MTKKENVYTHADVKFTWLSNNYCFQNTLLSTKGIYSLCTVNEKLNFSPGDLLGIEVKILGTSIRFQCMCAVVEEKIYSKDYYSLRFINLEEKIRNTIEEHIKKRGIRAPHIRKQGRTSYDTEISFLLDGRYVSLWRSFDISENGMLVFSVAPDAKKFEIGNTLTGKIKNKADNSEFEFTATVGRIVKLTLPRSGQSVDAYGLQIQGNINLLKLLSDKT